MKNTIQTNISEYRFYYEIVSREPLQLRYYLIDSEIGYVDIVMINNIPLITTARGTGLPNHSLISRQIIQLTKSFAL